MFYRCGAEVARGAHNSEVTRSRRVAGIRPIQYWVFSVALQKRRIIFRPLPWRTFYRLTPTLLMTYHHRSDSRMVIFLFITRTVWDRYLQVVNVKLDIKRSTIHDESCVFHRCGAEEARGAHNPEVTRSKRVAGIFHFSCFIEMRTYRQIYKLFYRGGAEEARWAHNSEDVGSKPTSGIFHFSCFIEMRMYRHTYIQNYFTGMAQRERAENTTSRSLDQNGLPVSLYQNHINTHCLYY